MIQQEGYCMGKILFLVLSCWLLACGSGGDDSDTRLGSLTLPLTVSTATHAYRLNGTIEIWQAGAHLQDFDLSPSAPSVVVPDLQPGNYDIFLHANQLLKDGAPVAFTLTSANPHPVSVVAGATTNDAWAFSVAGDPVAFQCTATTCGALSEQIAVTEVPPQ